MRLLNLKQIIFNFFYLSIIGSCSSQKMVYEPMGIMDKPLPTIEIVTQQPQKLDNKVFAIDAKTFALLVNYVNHGLVQSSTANQPDTFGAYKVIYSVGSNQTVFMLESKEESKEFFRGQLELIESHDELHKELEVLLKRLN